MLIGDADVAPGDISNGCDRVEQTDQVEADVHGGIKGGQQGKASSLEQVGKDPTPRLEQFIGTVPGCGGASTEAEDV
ncbi:hypothetical protein D3C76_1819480 [compost metagenome]